MKKRKKMPFGTRKIVQIETSLFVNVPKTLREIVGIQRGDFVSLSLCDGDRILIEKSDQRKTTN